MSFRIYPSIGIARIGNSPEFFIGPETPGAMGSDIDAGGIETPVVHFKDDQYRMRRQAARFRVFEFSDTSPAGREVTATNGVRLRWTVRLANRKDAVVRSSEPITERPQQPPTPLPQLDPSRANRVIAADGVAPSLGGGPVVLRGTYLTGTAFETAVQLAELRSDAHGRLLVIGASGISGSPEGAGIGTEESGGGFYTNHGWFDDVCDGQVEAEIVRPGSAPEHAEPAWVIVAPPDFAPATAAAVTLYDVIKQVAIDRFNLQMAERPSFSTDIWPMLRRAAGLRWVNSLPEWSQFSTDWSVLADPGAGSATLRGAHATRLRRIGNSLANVSLRPWQVKCLAEWERGNFDADFTGVTPDAGVIAPDHLTRCALDAAAGQGFFPGIEASIIVMSPAIYGTPFRVLSGLLPGSLSALMALPWQADFYDCSGRWWPSQRPDVAAQQDNPNQFLPWVRPIDDSDTPHRMLVTNVMRLGVIAPALDGGVDAMVETGRDPSYQ